MDTTTLVVDGVFGVYYVIVIILFFRVLLDNKNPLKTQSYLLILILLPLAGIIIYFFFGVNIRKQKMFSRKALRDEKLLAQFTEVYSRHLVRDKAHIFRLMQEMWRLPYLFWRNANAPLTERNTVEVFTNGEEKFPALISELKHASDHIHLEYYIIEKGALWQEIKELLIQKSKAGLRVRIIYDSLGSSALPKKDIRLLKKNGVEVAAYNPVIFTKLANRVNYRNHRKVVIVDGRTAFLGGINLSDRYDNSKDNSLFWRDTHCKIEGKAVYTLQTLFMLNWSFAAGQDLEIDPVYYPDDVKNDGDASCLVLNSEPDSDNANIMEAYFEVINAAKEEVLITTPYFIPPESILTALKTTAKSGVKVKLMLPQKSDTIFVQAASQTYFDEMLLNDVEVYLYEKGMIHAKVMVVDGKLVSLGTANMDYRSFEYNAEINAFFYNEALGQRLRADFVKDMESSKKLVIDEWRKRSFSKKLLGSVARLVAPLL